MQVLTAALDIVNTARSKFGVSQLPSMPRGRRKESLYCPLARALPDDPYVGRKCIRFRDEDAARALAKALGTISYFDPSAVRANVVGPERLSILERPWHVHIEGSTLGHFVDMFDKGLFPDLDK